ncbi:phospholipid-transporting ATPase ABCA3-like [Battus philenor]|uniref:phospholipid-transporting ATPase ABCA3-like n=1 Tax=Battus philenor TaxID=42288 RepID=UPI0035CEA8BB
MRRRQEQRHAAAMAKFKLLMWKNFLQQWRHPKQTIIELLLPVGTMALVLILRSEVEPLRQDIKVYSNFGAVSLIFSLSILHSMDISNLTFAYSPTNPLLHGVLKGAIVNLLIRNQNLLQINKLDLFEIRNNKDESSIYQNIESMVNLIGYNSSEELKSIYAEEETTRRIVAAIEFEDQLRDAEEIPFNMSYALRFPERPRLYSLYGFGGNTWRTDAVFPVFELPGPRFPYSVEGGVDPGYVTEMFIALQHSISTELISRITGKDLWSYRLNLQRYPHPEYVVDLAVEALQLLFPVLVVLSFSYTAVNLVRAVTVEKELQLKESMKIMGLPTWLHWTAWFAKQFLYLIFTVAFIIVLLKVHWFTAEDGFRDYAVFTNTPSSLLIFYFVLYLICMIFFCFMISGFFSKGSTAAVFAGIIWFLSYVPAVLLSTNVEVSTGLQVIACLSINTAMAYGFQLLLSKESVGGLQWGEFMTSVDAGSSRFVFGHVVIMLAIDCVIYMLIALYLEQVLPGPYGVSKKWYFFIQKDFWCHRSSFLLDDLLVEDVDPKTVKEKDPVGHQVGIKITNLTKVYGNNTVVNNLNLKIYKDQITVLLGHNGAGKSTTVSMITGNVEMTYGTVQLAGFDLRQQLDEARAHIGLCPQHNVLFNELTVHEHLEFYARLKGFSGCELVDEIERLITDLEMEEKRHCRSSKLSGGQKRRLCVGIALSGRAQVVLLDEPTSGMDPASRRALWDLLQKVKKGRTVILTTHFMDEADILGDRVAIMSSGRLQCIGSPYFLKQHYGVGYTLVVVKRTGFSSDVCTEIIRRYIPDITIKEDRGTELTYALTKEYSHIFEKIFNDLENNSDRIKFMNYGLVATTLEDVFMTVGSDAEIRTDCDDRTTINTSSTDNVSSNEFDMASLEQYTRHGCYDKVTGVHLLRQHVIAIWLKLWWVWSRSWGVLLLQVLVPLIQINATLGVLKYVLYNEAEIHSRPLTLAQGYVSTETLLAYNGTSTTSIGAIAMKGYEELFDTFDDDNIKVTIVNDKPLEDYYLTKMENSATRGFMRNRLLIGATFTDDSATAWFSNFGYHDVATSLGTMHSALLKAFNSTASLNVFNYPLKANYKDRENVQIMVNMIASQFSGGLGNSLGIVSAAFIIFYIKERISRTKLLQKAAGVEAVTLWSVAAVFDWLWFMIICLTVVISCAAFDVVGLSTVQELGRMYFCLMIYGAAMLPLHYLFSHFITGAPLGFVIMFFVNVLLGMLGAQIVEVLSMPQLDTRHVARIMDYVLQYFPLYSLVTAVRGLNKIGLTEFTCLQACDQLLVSRPYLKECTMETVCEILTSSCCVRSNPYFDWEEPGILRYLVSMMISCAVLWLLLMSVEYRVLRKIFNRQKSPPPMDFNSMDEDVENEAHHVQQLAGSGIIKHGLVAQSLSKYYGKHLAVNQVSFSVSNGECFGLLGVNGAGKTTTFKMLMGDESISSGDAFISGFSVRRNLNKVYENIGYCPQFDAVFNELTGRETLIIFSLFRGLSYSNAILKSEALAQSLGFTKHLDKRVSQYSGGNRRKLSTAVALVGRTRLVFVDEPTSGVDPAAKRVVWRALQAAQRAARGVLLTSHSMEECEALCSRLTIMVNGRFQCLGTPQHLKNKFSEGYTLTIKVKTLDDGSMSESALIAIKHYINENFTNSKLMEEYQGLLTYYLPDRSVAWSKMFGLLERAKEDYEIEDYCISQTTLEQIFLQFTKYQKTGP